MDGGGLERSWLGTSSDLGFGGIASRQHSISNRVEGVSRVGKIVCLDDNDLINLEAIKSFPAV